MASSFPFLRSVLCLLAIGGGSAATAPGLARTQGPPAMAAISGRVIDRITRLPITGAHVLLLGTAHDTASDSVGRFSHPALTSGTYLLQIRAVGYSMTTWVLRLRTDEHVDQEFPIASLALGMDTVTAVGRPGVMEQRMREFERRRHEGRGAFITEADIQRENATTVGDVLRTAAGVRMLCNSTGCAVRMTRAARGACKPDFYVDGFPSAFATTGGLRTVGVVGIEIYRSLSETPPEFLKAGATCGVIVIWTRSGPAAGH